MKHEQIVEQLLVKARSDSNTLGFLVFGSVASGTHHEKSDIDTMTILRNHKPSSGIENTMIGGIKVGNLFFTHEILTRSVNTVPYFYTLWEMQSFSSIVRTPSSLYSKRSQPISMKILKSRMSGVDTTKSSKRRKRNLDMKKQQSSMFGMSLKNVIQKEKSNAPSSTLSILPTHSYFHY